MVSLTTLAQEKGIKSLDFLIGTWETREDIAADNWWETTTRKISYDLMENYIVIHGKSIDSKGKKREYKWFINYNKKAKQFQMVSMFSNWYKTQLDILEWNEYTRTLTIRHQPNSETEFHERFGELVFAEDFKGYVWKGENKYGDTNNPGIWKYIEEGKKIND